MELLLHCTNEDKILNMAGNVDWESCYKKRSAILNLVKAKYPSREESKRMGKDYDPAVILMIVQKLQR